MDIGIFSWGVIFEERERAVEKREEKKKKKKKRGTSYISKFEVTMDGNYSAAMQENAMEEASN